MEVVGFWFRSEDFGEKFAVVSFLSEEVTDLVVGDGEEERFYGGVDDEGCASFPEFEEYRLDQFFSVLVGFEISEAEGEEAAGVGSIEFIERCGVAVFEAG